MLSWVTAVGLRSVHKEGPDQLRPLADRDAETLRGVGPLGPGMAYTRGDGVPVAAGAWEVPGGLDVVRGLRVESPTRRPATIRLGHLPARERTALFLALQEHGWPISPRRPA